MMKNFSAVHPYDLYFMRIALEEAKIASGRGEIPVGALIVRDGEIIGKGSNVRKIDNLPFAHAEMQAIAEAGEKISSWRFDGCTLYVTLEPCAMCAGAIAETRISRVVYGARDPKQGAAGSLYDILRDPRTPHKCEVLSGIMAEESAKLLGDFFIRRRRQTKEGKRI